MIEFIAQAPIGAFLIGIYLLVAAFALAQAIIVLIAAAIRPRRKRRPLP